MQFRVAVCDDMEVFVDEIKGYIEKYAKEYKKEIEVVTYFDGCEFIDEAEKKKFDLVFLDVDMPIMNGIETANWIRQFDKDLVIIFITSHDNFSLEATKVEAMGYMVKPIIEEVFYRLVNKAFILIQGIQEERQKELRFFEVKVDYEKQVLDVAHIACMEKSRNQLIIFMDDGKEYICYETIKNVITRLPRILFYQVSSSLIVNMMMVRGVKSNIITINIHGTEREFSISRGNAVKIRNSYLNFSKIRRGK